MGSFDFVTLFFFVAAVIIFLQLRNVLGRRTGNEPRHTDRTNPREGLGTGDGGDDDNVVTLPRRNGRAADDAEFEAVDRYAKPGSDLNAGLRAISAADPSFHPKEFLKGSQMAYEMIVTAFAEGDRKSLKNLLSREVYEGFVSAINERESRSETVKSSFVGIDTADIVQADMVGTDASVTVRIISQLISATYNQDDEVIDGDPESVAEVKDVWTFSRDTRSRDPNWKLIATESEE